MRHEFTTTHRFIPCQRRKSRGPVTPEGKLASASNSAQSTGPVTPEGKAISSQNATVHGVLAQSIVLPSECEKGFNSVLTDLRDELQPATATERRLVEVMAVADWRRSRLWCLEMAHYVHAIHAQERAADPIANQENSEIPSMHTALAFAALTDHSQVLERLNRYEIRYSREYLRSLIYYRAQRAGSPSDASNFQTK